MIRRIEARDIRFLRDMLHHAFYRREVPAGEDEQPVYRYVMAWGRRGDAGVLALDEGFPVGAAWYRLFKQAEPGYGFVDEETPELAIAVVPSRRGRGVGHELMTALLEHARREGYPAISLSVEKDSPAVKLYERYGFERVAETPEALVMRAGLN
jgi:ribosomal protein S18 acetylase RimI-like enzyme